MDHYRKISSEMQMAEADIISRLRREAAERAHDLEELTNPRSNGYTSPIDPEFYNTNDTTSERIRKKSYGLGRLEEDTDQYASRPLSYRSSGDSDAGRPRDRHVTRRSISRELHDYNPSPSWTTSSPVDFSRERSSRERSLGRDLEPILDVERRIANRRSESLSRPSLASHGRSLTQNELGSSGTRSYLPDTSSTGTSGLRSGLRSSLRSPLTIQDNDDVLSRISNSSKLSGSSALDDRNRADWRRVSVPERGKDFKSLSKKYNR